MEKSNRLSSTWSRLYLNEHYSGHFRSPQDYFRKDRVESRLVSIVAQHFRFGLNVKLMSLSYALRLDSIRPSAHTTTTNNLSTNPKISIIRIPPPPKIAEWANSQNANPKPKSQIKKMGNILNHAGNYSHLQLS